MNRRYLIAIAVAVAGLGLAGLGQLVPNRHSIEDKLTQRSTAALEGAGLTGVQVRFVGRDGELVLPSTADVDRAREIVADLAGVRVVSARGLENPAPPSETPAPKPPEVVQRALTDLPQITFEDNSATLTPQGQAAVAQAAAILRDNPDAKVSIEGHTDGNGSPEANQLLSQARAQTVLDALVSLGIAADRLSSAGFGESRPRVPDTTPENQALNRRVEFVVL